MKKHYRCCINSFVLCYGKCQFQSGGSYLKPQVLKGYKIFSSPVKKHVAYHFIPNIL